MHSPGSSLPAVPLTQVKASGPKPWHSANACRVALLDPPTLSLHIWLTGSTLTAPAPTASRMQAQPHQVPSPGWPPLGIRPPLPLLRAHTQVPDPNVLRRVSLQSSASSNCQKYTSKISISLKLPSEGSGSKGGKTHALEKGRGLTWRQQFSHFFFFFNLFVLVAPTVCIQEFLPCSTHIPI